MTLDRIAERLQAEILWGENLERIEIQTVCGSDLMSDVLCFGRTQGLLLTGLVNPQSVRTAEMAEIPAVCFVRGKRPPAETIELGRKSRICLLSTRLSMFAACGLLYSEGLGGCNEGD